MCQLYQVRDLFKFVESVIRMMHHDSIEDFSQMGVQIQLDRAATFFGLFQLLLNPLQGVQLNAHFQFFITF
jgi:hypothetical protein